jgi:hypothetical protein
MRRFILIALLLCIPLQTASAQEILDLDRLTSGSLSADSPTASYFIAVKAGEALHLQAVAVSNGLVLEATLNTATGALVESFPNPENSPALEADFTPADDGILRLDVSSETGGAGQFVLLVQEITAPEADAELLPDEQVTDTLNPNASILYALSGDRASRLILSVTTTDPLDNLDVQLLNASGAVVAAVEMQDGEGELLIPARRADYTLKLDNSQPTAVSYEIMLAAVDGQSSTPAPTLAATNALSCTVTPLSIAVNVRRGPSTRFDAFMSLQPGATLNAVARNTDGSWYQVQTDAQTLGWVAGSVVSATGPCAGLQAIFVPTPTFAPVTSTPTVEPVVGATSTPIPRCDPYQFYHQEDNGAYLIISLPSEELGSVINYRDGYHTEYVFPTCRAILWTAVTFTCTSYLGGDPYWLLSAYASFDWNATCGVNTNADQRGMSFGVR